MKHLLFYCLFYVALLLLEMVVSIGGLFAWHARHRGLVDGVVLWTFWRLLFYGLPSLAVLWACARASAGVRPTRRLLLFCAVNLLTYVALSVSSQSIWRNVPLPAEGMLFRVTCVALLVSPLLIGSIPFVRRRMQSFT